jgi:hypothetical protein
LADHLLQREFRGGNFGLIAIQRRWRYLLSQSLLRFGFTMYILIQLIFVCMLSSCFSFFRRTRHRNVVAVSDARFGLLLL